MNHLRTILCGLSNASLLLDMHDPNNVTGNPTTTWRPWQAYGMAVICMVVGLMVGYLARGSAPTSPTDTPSTEPVATAGTTAPTTPAGRSTPSLDDMKRMADKQVEPLLVKLQKDPGNADLLNEVGNVYRLTHQFQTAAGYYQKSLEVNPRNVGPRTDLASCLYYQGDVDGAISQLEKSLSYDPKHAGTLLNLGLIRLQGKNDSAGAIEAWSRLLKSNPQFKDRAMVEKLIADAKAQSVKKAIGS